MRRKIKEETTRVKIERELGHSWYSCESCGASLNGVVKDHLDKIISAKLADKEDSLELYCPRCRKRLDFSHLGVKGEIGLQEVEVKVQRVKG